MHFDVLDKPRTLSMPVRRRPLKRPTVPQRPAASASGVAGGTWKAGVDSAPVFVDLNNAALGQWFIRESGDAQSSPTLGALSEVPRERRIPMIVLDATAADLTHPASVAAGPSGRVPHVVTAVNTPATPRTPPASHVGKDSSMPPIRARNSRSIPHQRPTFVATAGENHGQTGARAGCEPIAQCIR